ncbi:DUF433 domain-containing protein [Candidatus Riflebacteria bacterium]
MAKIKDPREFPAYELTEIAHYIRRPRSTVRSWVMGREYPVGDKKGFFKPLIHLSDPEKRLFSFFNLVEAHVLDSIRREHRIPLHRVRHALEYIRKKFYTSRPLAEKKFLTDGIDLFLNEAGLLVNVSSKGQLHMRENLENYLKRIEWDERGLARRLFLFTRKGQADEPRIIVVDPRVSFGRPVLNGTGIPTNIIAERYKAGETIKELARDYGRGSEEIEEAVRCELQIQAA